MELHRPRSELRVVETLDRPVVQRDVGRRAVGRGADREPMVLRGHEYPAGRLLEHGVVGAAVAERQLERLVAGREREELVAEADPEDRNVAEERLDRRDLTREWLGVARPVREDDAVEVDEVAGSRGRRKDRDSRSRGDQPTEDRALAAVVD